MNSLTWFLYGIGVFPNIQLVAILTTVAFGLVAAISGIIHICHVYEGDESPVPNSILKKLFMILFIAAFVGAVTPNRQTMILMAASEVGQKLLTHDKVTGIVDPSINLLQKYIEKETISITKSIKDLKDPEK